MARERALANTLEPEESLFVSMVVAGCGTMVAVVLQPARAVLVRAQRRGGRRDALAGRLLGEPTVHARYCEDNQAARQNMVARHVHE